MGRDNKMDIASSDPRSDQAPASVFLSYSHDDRAKALPVIKALEAEGFKVWWDGLLEGGAAFAQTTEAALETSDAVVVLWSATSIQSHWVRDEARRGRDRGCMVPVSIDGIEPPLGFRQIQYVDLKRWRGKRAAPEFAELARAVRLAAAPGDQLAGVKPPPPASTGATRRTVLRAGAAGALGLGAVLAAWKGGLFGRGAAPDNSVAVLPFKNLSGDAAQSYFSDGLSEEVRSTLSRNSMLRVLAPISSGKFRDHSEDAPSVAAKLGVAYLLEGSVRRAGNLVRISAELIDGKTGFSRWSESFDRALEDVFAIQSEIAETVADALAAHMTLGTKADPGGTSNVAAFDAYLKGKGLAGQSASEATDRAALAQFDAAIALDPEYAKAHAARSRALTVIANQYASEAEFKSLYGGAIEAAKRAVALAPDLADGYSVLGFALFQGQLDVRAARNPYDRSSVLGTGDATIMARFSSYCAWTGRAREAEVAIARALRLDPLNASIWRASGMTLIAARQFAAAIPQFEKAIALNPKIRGAHAQIADCLVQLGRFKEARQASLAETQDLLRYTSLAIVEHKLGNEAGARRAMDMLTSGLTVGTVYQQAQVLATWGDGDAALARLVEARAIGDSGMVFARNDAALDSVRADPRFIRLLKDMGFD